MVLVDPRARALSEANSTPGQQDDKGNECPNHARNMIHAAPTNASTT